MRIEAKRKDQAERDQELLDVLDTYPSLKHLSDETKRSWFKIEEIGGHKILKVKPEMFTPPVNPVFWRNE